jgi:hypothetical protein
VKPFACRIFPAEGKNSSWCPSGLERSGRFTFFPLGLRAKPALGVDQSEGQIQLVS